MKITQTIKNLINQKEEKVHLSSWLMAAGTWIGALLITIFLFTLNLFEDPSARIIFGIIFLIGSGLTSRKDNIINLQLVIVQSLAAHFLFFSGLIEASSFSDSTIALFLALLQIGLFFLIKNQFHRLASVVIFISSFYFFISDLIFEGFSLQHSSHYFHLTLIFLSSILTITTTFLWVKEAAISIKHPKHWMPLSYGSTIALLGSLVLISTSKFEAQLYTSYRISSSTPTMIATAILAIITVSCFLWLIKATVQELKSTWKSHQWITIIISLITISAASFHITGLITSLLLLCIAKQRQNKTLHYTSLTFIFLFISSFYYQLQTTLLWKSLYMAITGTVLIASYFGFQLLSPTTKIRETTQPDSTLKRILKISIAPILVSLVISCLVIQKENLLQNGRSIFLKLAPVDPRSLIQGDYMILDYETIRNYQTQQSDYPETKNTIRKTQFIFEVDNQNVATIVEEYTPNQKLKTNQFVLNIKITGYYQLNLGAESFLFQEGDGTYYEQAEYSELKVDPSGNTLLVGLRDKNLEPLNSPPKAQQ